MPIGRRLVLFYLFLCLAAPAFPARSSSPTRPQPASVYVEVQLQEWLDGYLKWVVAHPAVIVAAEKKGNTPGPRLDGAGAEESPTAPRLDGTASGSANLQLHTPFLDYFSPDGKSLYAGTLLSANVDFLNKLHRAANPSPPDNEIQPTLSEYLDMFPELARYKRGILGLDRPVLLAICEPATPSCKRQNEALGEFKNRQAALGVQLVEVTLLRPPAGK